MKLGRLLSGGVAAAALVVFAATVGNTAAPPDAGLFAAVLSGDREVPPVETDARGFSGFRALPGEQALLFGVLTFRLEEATQAHIHLGGPDENGPIVAFLFESDDPVTRTGLLALGVLTADDLIGPLAGGTIADLLDEMSSGNAYVNVHTTAHPSGEIRGQIFAPPRPQK